MSFKEFVIKNCEAKELRSFDNIVDSLVSLVLIYFTAFFIQKILVIHKEANACFICICLLALFSIYSIKWVKFITSIYRNLLAFILIFIYPLAVFGYIYYTPKFSSIDNKYIIIFFYLKWLEVVFFFYLIWLIILLKDLEKFIWGVQIQSLRSTAFAIIFMLFSSVILSISVNSYFNNNLSFSEKQTIYYQDQSQQIKIKKFSENQKIEQEILDKKVGDKIDDNLSGLGDIMIGIGSALMALSIFVYESIARKRHYFDKYYLTGLTNNIVLTILYFIGLLGLLLVYVFENYDWVKIFLEPTLYCYVSLLIIFAVIRFYLTAIGMLFREKGMKIENQIVESFFENLQRKKATNSNEYSFLLEDFCDDAINKLKEGKILQVKDDWRVINVYLEKLIDCIKKNPKIQFDLMFFERFLIQYLHYIPKEIDSISFQKLIYETEIFFAVIINKNILIKKNIYQFSNPFQNYLFFYQAMYQKGFEMQKDLDKLSSNEQYIANKLLIESRRAPKKFAHSYLLTNYKNNKINPEFFENYAIEFLIYFRDLALKCFENNDDNNFDKTLLSLKNTFMEYLEYNQELDNILQKTYKYKEAVLYGIGACILCEVKIDDKEDNIEKIGKFLVIINKHFNQILNIQISNNWQYYEGKGKKFFKIFCNIKEDKIYNYLAGIDKYSFKVDVNKDYDDFDYNFDDDQKKNSNEIIYNFFIFILLMNPEYFNFLSVKIIQEISQIIGEQKDWFFDDIIKILENLKSNFENNFEIIIHNSKKQKTKVAFDNLILKLLRECKVEKIKENIDELNRKLNEIKSHLKNKKEYLIKNNKADQDLIKICKNDLIEGYYKINNIKNTKIFQINIPSKDVKPNKILIINPIYDKEPFIKDSKISTDIGRAIGEEMAKSENRLITNEIINKIKPESQKIDLNKFHNIILQIPNIKDAVIILLSNPYELTRELKKRTFYNNNFKSLNDEDKKLYPQKYNKEQIGFYEIFVENKPYEIPVYNYYSDKADGVMVLDKSRLGTIIQYDMSDDYKERESAIAQIDEILREKKFDENFTKEFYLDLIEFDDNNQYFKNLLDQEKQPDWIKQKGDRAEQKKFLEQHVIFVFKQAFEIEFAKNFFGYLFEIEKEY